MRPFWRYLAMLLMFSLTPGAAEAVENVAHVVKEGHLAHASDHQDAHAQDTDEHGCTSVFHACSCHTASPVVHELGLNFDFTTAVIERSVAALPAETPRAEGTVGGLFRPPRG